MSLSLAPYAPAYRAGRQLEQWMYTPLDVLDLVTEAVYLIWFLEILFSFDSKFKRPTYKGKKVRLWMSAVVHTLMYR